jgi:hypothetical protein
MIWEFSISIIHCNKMFHYKPFISIHHDFHEKPPKKITTFRGGTAAFASATASPMHFNGFSEAQLAMAAARASRVALTRPRWFQRRFFKGEKFGGVFRWKIWDKWMEIGNCTMKLGENMSKLKWEVRNI